MNRKEHLLDILAEESNEVAQRVSKALRFGLKEVQPGQPYTNAERLRHEINDFMAMLYMLENENILDPVPDTDLGAWIVRKIDKVEEHLLLSKEQGTLSD